MPPRKNNPNAPFVAKPAQRRDRGIIDAYKTKAGAPFENDPMTVPPNSPNMRDYLDPAGEMKRT